MIQGVQTLFGEAGEAACYSLALIQTAIDDLGHEIDPLDSFIRAFRHGYIYYNWEDTNDNKNFFVEDPAKFLSMLTGKVWTVRHEDNVKYQPKPGEFVIQRWERKATGTVYSHFRKPEWDSLKNSQTVAKGKIVSLRICKKV